jgi:hypothetical protein
MNAIGKDIQDCDFVGPHAVLHLGSIERPRFRRYQRRESVEAGRRRLPHQRIKSLQARRSKWATVLFRRRDIEKLIERLESRGHKVKPLPIEPAKSVIDLLVDLPPYDSDLSLRLKLGKFVTTSFGIVISRGAS